MEEEQVVEAILGDGEEAAFLVDAGVGAAGRVVDEGHLAEEVAGAEDGEGLLAHAGHLAADADATLDDEVEGLADVAVLEDLGADGVAFFLGDARDEGEGVLGEPVKEGDLAELLDTFQAHSGAS